MCDGGTGHCVAIHTQVTAVPLLTLSCPLCPLSLMLGTLCIRTGSTLLSHSLSSFSLVTPRRSAPSRPTGEVCLLHSTLKSWRKGNWSHSRMVRCLLWSGRTREMSLWCPPYMIIAHAKCSDVVKESPSVNLYPTYYKLQLPHEWFRSQRPDACVLPVQEENP